MTPQAKDEMFKDGKLRQSLDDIANLASATRESKNIAEHGSHKGLLTGNLGLQLAWAVAHPPSYIGGGAAQYITGKLLSSPKFARWLANAPVKGDPAMQRRALDQLGVLASQDPVIRNDALALHQHLENRSRVHQGWLTPRRKTTVGANHQRNSAHNQNRHVRRVRIARLPPARR